MLPPEGDVLSKGAADGPINAFIPRSATAAILSFSSKTFIFLHCSNLFFAYFIHYGSHEKLRGAYLEMI